MPAQFPSPSSILIVDPSADEREMYCLYLASCGVAVAGASDLRSALEQVKRLSPAIVTTELRTAGVDGVTLCKLLKRRRPGIRVIACTADSFGAKGADVRAAGFDAVLLKPCLPSSLLMEIGHQLETPPRSVPSGWPQPQTPEPIGELRKQASGGRAARKTSA